MHKRRKRYMKELLSKREESSKNLFLFISEIQDAKKAESPKDRLKMQTDW